MKLLLTSTGLTNKKVENTFLKMLDKSIEKINVIFIPTASRSAEELKYVEESRQELIDLGIKNIKTLDLNNKVDKNVLENIDIIYVCGGNTFYLLSKIRESGFDKIIQNYNGIYVGVSAGSIIVGPNIEVANLPPADENNVNLLDTTGLNIVNFAIVPHYIKKDHAIIQKFRDKVNYEIIEISNNQAVLVENGKRKIM